MMSYRQSAVVSLHHGLAAPAPRRLLLLGEARQVVDARRQPALEQPQRLTVDHQVAVVGDEAAGRAEVDDRLGRGRQLAVVVHVRHHVVPHLQGQHEHSFCQQLLETSF